MWNEVQHVFVFAFFTSREAEIDKTNYRYAMHFPPCDLYFTVLDKSHHILTVADKHS